MATYSTKRRRGESEEVQVDTTHEEDKKRLTSQLEELKTLKAPTDRNKISGAQGTYPGH